MIRYAYSAIRADQKMMNISNELHQNGLSAIIQDYLSANQRAENAFLCNVQQAQNRFCNGWREFNRVRVQNQAKNWAIFINKLQKQMPQKQQTQYLLFDGGNKQPQPLLPHQPPPKACNSRKTFQSPPNSASHKKERKGRKNKLKSGQEYKCKIEKCTKIYTTKGNLNRHLRDFHKLKPDLTPFSDKTSKKIKILKQNEAISNEKEQKTELCEKSVSCSNSANKNQQSAPLSVCSHYLCHHQIMHVLFCFGLLKGTTNAPYLCFICSIEQSKFSQFACI